MLGIVWDESKDEFIFDFKYIVSEAQKLNVTKRNVLQVIASFYDPVGLIQPVPVNMKLFFQTLFKLNLEWDGELAPDLKEEWDKILREVGQLKSIRIPRCYIVTEIHDPVINYQLHSFSDAVKVAFGCCIYLLALKESGDIKMNLVTSKSRVAPLKEQSLPLLELLGNLTAARLNAVVLSALSEEYKFNNYFC